MAGLGDRFRRAGYKDPKPLIVIDGRPMIEHVVRLFPGETRFLFICNEQHLAATPLRLTLERIAPRCTIAGIEPHKLGPVHTVLRGADLIDDAEPVIVNYCDFSVYWDYAAFVENVSRTACHGAVTAYRNFHPHSLGPNYYAYIRERNREMLEIKEKGCFTDNRLTEYASTGTHYFASGALMKRYFQELVQSGSTVNGEFYVSMVYNLLVRDRLQVRVFEVEHFLQWGTPEDLEEYLYWSEACDRRAFDLSCNSKSSAGSDELWANVTAIIPMAGEGSRFRAAGYTTPKPLISVSGRPMVVQAVRTLPCAGEWLFICRQELARVVHGAIAELSITARVLAVDQPTEGQACTCLQAEGFVPRTRPILIAACDTGLLYDHRVLDSLLASGKADVVVFTFRHYAPAARRPQLYGWVNTDGRRVLGVSTKTPISATPLRDQAIVGAFYFKRAGDFYDAARRLIGKDRRINGEFYVDECINEAIAMGLTVHIFEVDKYLCWGTPDELRTFEYWQEYFRKASRLKGPLLSELGCLERQSLADER